MEHVDFLKQLVETPSPTGSEEQVAALVRARLAPIATEIETDIMGSVHARLAGTGSANGCADGGVTCGEGGEGAAGEAGVNATGAVPSVMLCAHMDEVGLMVHYISDEGYLSVSAIGGVDAAILPGLRVDVHTATGTLRGVVGRMPIHLIKADDRKTVTPLDQLVIDIGMPAEKVKELVHVGDSITYGVGFEEFGEGMAVSRAFDDKAGVWVACRVMELLAESGGAAADYIACATVQEEIGTRGAITSAYGVNPGIGLALDVTHATDYPGIDKAKFGAIYCGRGPVIAKGPNINPVVFKRLCAAAEKAGIEYQIEAEPGVTGTDARSIQVARDGICCGLISIPLRYMHTPTEVISLADAEATAKLIAQFVRDVDAQTCFIPGLGE